jgi:hypothetical protein
MHQSFHSDGNKGVTVVVMVTIDVCIERDFWIAV